MKERRDEDRRWLAKLSVVVAALTLIPRNADANSFGITNFSGKHTFFCITCHSNGDPPGVVPVVAFEAPGGTTMAVGAIATFRFRVTSMSIPEQTHAGFNVASSDGLIGITDAVGTLTQEVFGEVEITHSEPRANDDRGVAVFEFSWRAPTTPGTYTLYGAGNSVDDDDSALGDGSAHTTLAIEVIGPPTATPTDTATVTLTATPTSTAAETPTPSSTAPPTATLSQSVCLGDCDNDDRVTVDEILTGVTIALGDFPTADCPAFDRDGSMTVTVDELEEAIQNALNGC